MRNYWTLCLDKVSSCFGVYPPKMSEMYLPFGVKFVKICLERYLCSVGVIRGPRTPHNPNISISWPGNFQNLGIFVRKKIGKFCPISRACLVEKPKFVRTTGRGVNIGKVIIFLRCQCIITVCSGSFSNIHQFYITYEQNCFSKSRTGVPVTITDFGI